MYGQTADDGHVFQYVLFIINYLTFQLLCDRTYAFIINVPTKPKASAEENVLRYGLYKPYACARRLIR